MNIAEILKNCPTGMKLYSPIYGELSLVGVHTKTLSTYPICCYVVRSGNAVSFTKDGKFNTTNDELTLFPSKDQRDWSKFRLPVKRGDIMMTIDKRAFITNGRINNDGCPCAYCGINSYHDFIIGSTTSGWTSLFYIPASEEAKKELFIKMGIAGYTWNANTLELEKIEPKKPFDKVLVRNQTNEKWSINLFSYYEEGTIFPYVCLDGKYHHCVPYEGHEYLVGTTINPPLMGG